LEIGSGKDKIMTLPPTGAFDGCRKQRLRFRANRAKKRKKRGARKNLGRETSATTQLQTNTGGKRTLPTEKRKKGKDETPATGKPNSSNHKSKQHLGKASMTKIEKKKRGQESPT